MATPSRRDFDPEEAARLLLLREAIAAEAVALPDLRERLDTMDDAADRLRLQTRVALEQDDALGRLAGQLPWLTGIRPGAWLLLPALLAGMLFSGLSAGGRFNILAPPMLGLLAWQLAIYLLLLWPRPARAAPRAGSRILPWLGQRLVTLGAGRRMAAVPGRFLLAFGSEASDLMRQRLAATLHGAAAAFALGAILGLYWDGLGVAYHAYWESTFLGADAVTVIVTGLLTPASLVSGIPLPDRAAVAAMATTAVPAAPWIHLWAVTVALLAVLPRLALTLLAAWRLRRIQHISLDLRHPILRRMLAAGGGKRVSLSLQPLAYRPDAGNLERLHDRLAEHFHAPVQVDLAPAVAADPEALPPSPEGVDRRVLLLSPAQTPELERHGPLFAAAAADLPLTVVLDAAAYRTTAERLQSRLAAWQQLLSSEGIDHLILEPAA